MSKLPDDLVEISSYNGRQGTVELNGLMYSPSEKALYNKGFLNKKININNKRNFYSYIKTENPRERKRICINLNSFLKQYPQYECIKENKNVEIKENKKNEKNEEEKSDQKNEDQDISIDISIGENNNENNNEDKATPADAKSPENSNGIDQDQFLDILNNYKD